MNDRLVSIIINNHDYELFLRQAIDSALGQSHGHVEVIVVDDGSTDGSRDIIRGYGDAVIQVLKSNGGQASAFNAGFARSSGSTVLMLDSDDVLFRDAAATATEALADPAVVHAHWQMPEIDADGRPTGRLHPAEPQREGDLLEEAFRLGPLADLHPPTSGNAWARDFLEAVLPLDEGEPVGADAWLFTLSPTYGLVKRLDVPLSAYRVHGTSHYHGSALRRKVSLDLRLWEARCQALEQRATAMGRDIDSASWRSDRSVYRWMCKVLAAVDDIARVVPPSSRYVLIEGGQFGHADVVPDRFAEPLMQRGGMDDGAPADDEAALAALAAARARGLRHVVVAFPAFWWFDVYPRFTEHLRGRYVSLLANDRIVGYDLEADA